MKLTNGDIFQSREPLQELLGQKFPVLVSYKLAKLANKLNDQLKVIEEVRTALIKKYGTPNERGAASVTPSLETKDAEGKIVKTEPNPQWQPFVDEFNELMEQEVTLVIEKVKLPEKVSATCDSCKHNMDKPLEIEPKLLLALEKFVEV